MQLRDNKWFMFVCRHWWPCPNCLREFQGYKACGLSWNTPDKIWSEEEKEEEVTDMLRESYSLLYMVLPCWNEESFRVQNTPQLSGQPLHDQQLLSRFLKASLALAALPRPILHRWAVSHHSSSGRQNVSSFCSSHTRRDCFSRTAFKNKLITTRNFSSTLTSQFSFVPVARARFSTLKLLRTLSL